MKILGLFCLCSPFFQEKSQYNEHWKLYDVLRVLNRLTAVHGLRIKAARRNVVAKKKMVHVSQVAMAEDKAKKCFFLCHFRNILASRMQLQLTFPSLDKTYVAETFSWFSLDTLGTFCDIVF